MKFLVMFLALAGFAFANDGSIGGVDLIKAVSMAAGVVGLGIAALGGAISMGYAASATISGMARNPGMANKLSTTMFIAMAMIEAQVIYTLVFAIIAIYANPFLG